MTFKAQYIPYHKTASFSQVVIDYLDDSPLLHPFYTHRPDFEGIRHAIDARKKSTINRHLLHETLVNQYASMPVHEKVQENINLLPDENTFTICTAHQPNIFTGHLYFIYKIIHAIKLADELNEQYSDCRFVPVYYMGSEDADLEELGEVNISGKKYDWATGQTGAVGRMLVDQSLLQIVDGIEGQLLVEPYGKDVLKLIRSFYTKGKTIEQATFELVDALFASYGLLVILPDRPSLKKAFSGIIRNELFNRFSQPLVTETISRFPEKYHAQVAGRDINLFYLTDGLRERITWKDDVFTIANTSLSFTVQDMEAELAAHPERFSPNVILRPVFQELILPNVAFIGGGGELAYWLELQQVFNETAVPFPVLILRNSFAIVPDRIGQLMDKLAIDSVDVFKKEQDLLAGIVTKNSSLQLTLDEERRAIDNVYVQIKSIATTVDKSLEKHVLSLGVRANHALIELEKKMLRAEKKKSAATARQVATIKSTLFPDGVLQERVNNIFPFLAKYGTVFLQTLYEASTGITKDFCLLYENEK